jgi:hypothetical protein
MPKVLWLLVILGFVCALPIAYQRHATETSTKNVEFVFDYRDLLDIADLKANPRDYVADQLERMKQAGIGSLSVYESTLQELKESRRIEVFSSHEAAALTQRPISPNENFTYVIFTEQNTQKQLQDMIVKAFSQLNVKTTPWSFKNQPGLIIQMAMDEAMLKPMDPDPFTMQMLKDKGFQVVVRLSNRRPFNAQDMDALLARLHDLGVTRIIVDGDEVPGYQEGSTENLGKMSLLLRRHGIGLAAIELLKEPQKGFNTLAKDIYYNVVRLHSFTEKDGEKLTENGLKKSELNQRIQQTADRFVLAVKDRNIRMVFLNAKPGKNIDKGTISDPLDAIYASLNGPDGAVKRVQELGLTLGPAKPFQIHESGWQKIARVFILLGGVSFIALTAAYFIPEAALLLFVVGVIGAMGLHALSANLYAQGLALGTAICAPSLAVMLAIRSVQSGQAAEAKSRLGYAFLLLLRTSVISLVGVGYVVSLLNNITYFLVLQQFRGVSLLHLLPIGIVALYLLFFSENLSGRERVQKLKKMLAFNINVLWIVIAGVALVGIYYYLTRTGNEGQASGVEKLFRSFLENVLRVRPRTKEFLLAHPLFLLGGYLAVKHRKAVYFLLIGVIGQLSIVDTFCHLHTPLLISAIRITYGLVFGALIGLVYIAVWQVLARGWNRWAPAFKE